MKTGWFLLHLQDCMAPTTPLSLWMKNRQWRKDEMDTKPCVCVNLPHLQTQTGVISAVSWSCNINSTLTKSKDLLCNFCLIFMGCDSWMFLLEGSNWFQSGIGEPVSLANVYCHTQSSYDVILRTTISENDLFQAWFQMVLGWQTSNSH